MGSVYAGLGVLCGVSVIWCLIQVSQYTKRNPSTSFEKNSDRNAGLIFKCIYYMLNTFGNLMYLLIFLFCMATYATYKNQMNATLLLPELGPASEQVYSWINVILLLTLFSKLIAVMMRIVEQSCMDVYLVDFEKPNRDTKQVNAWRYMFIANEFAEL